MGLFVGCVTLAVAVFVMVYNNYLEQMFNHDFQLFDVKTVTAADYTVELKVKKIFSKFKDENSQVEGMSVAFLFRSWLLQQLETRIAQVPS